ncbi:MAG: PilZ domain-containing protein [Candidatus Eremiobacteraeota bacterium]|nr:PilZ domain-containing protein [Candidatus Eremiobacteraeota bacterium]MCL5054459.1 PilZ domain-containing protein [Bacillota bacterium]
MTDFEERREFVRMPASSKAIVHQNKKKWDASVIDISPGGCQLLCSEKLKKEIPIKLDFFLNAADPSVRIQGNIAWTKKHESKPLWRHGIQFKEKGKFEKLGAMFIDYLIFKKKMEQIKKGK